MDQDEFTEPAVDLNGIILGGDSARWLQAHQLAPSDWKLDNTEAQRILSAQIRLFVFHSPVFDLDLRPNEFGLAFVGHLICFDAALVKTQSGNSDKTECNGILTKEGAIATILHEIGHTVNRWQPPTNPAERLNAQGARGKYAFEFDADDYARHCGFGDHLANALEALLNARLPHFGGEGNQQRIQRIKTGADVQHHFSTGTANCCRPPRGANPPA